MRVKFAPACSLAGGEVRGRGRVDADLEVALVLDLLHLHLRKQTPLLRVLTAFSLPCLGLRALVQRLRRGARGHRELLSRSARPGSAVGRKAGQGEAGQGEAGWSTTVQGPFNPAAHTSIARETRRCSMALLMQLMRARAEFTRAPASLASW